MENNTKFCRVQIKYSLRFHVTSSEFYQPTLFSHYLLKAVSYAVSEFEATQLGVLSCISKPVAYLFYISFYPFDTIITFVSVK